MRICLHGVTRIVFIFRGFVIKIPNFTYSWDHFLKGLVSNIREKNTWNYNGYSEERRLLREELLCPVLWCSWGGWILVMRKADVDRHYTEVYNAAYYGNIDPEKEVALRYKKWIDAGFGGDDKCDNYGYLGDRLVKIDY